MPGTKSSGRPGGNPEIKKYGFKTNRAESCTAQISLRIPPSLKAELTQKENWQELVRQAIAEKLQSA